MSLSDHPETRINPALFPVAESGRQDFAGAVSGDGDLSGGLAKAISEYMGDSTNTANSMYLRGGVPVHRAPPRTTTSLTHIFEGAIN